MSIIMQQMFSPPLPPSKRYPKKQFSPILENLTLQTLAKNPQDRPQSASEFKEILQKALNDDDSSKTILPKTRNERANAIGLPEIKTDITSKLPKHSIIIIEDEKPSMESIIIGVWGSGFKARSANDLTEAQTIIQKSSNAIISVIVFDITSSPKQSLQELTPFIQNSQTPVIIVGSDDNFEDMNKALEIGAFEYVAISQTIKKLPKSLRRLIRRYHSKKQKSLT